MECVVNETIYKEPMEFMLEKTKNKCINNSLRFFKIMVSGIKEIKENNERVGGKEVGSLSSD